ncbi:zinc finger protein 91-like isoform X3 [Sipha flava]|nr:zinc finger protein 91-like isoform X3 [Sipha flava]
MEKSVNSLNIPNSNVYFISNSLNFPLHSNIQISQNNLPIQHINIENKSIIRPIKPKITNDVEIISSPQRRSNASLNNKLQNTTLKNNLSTKPKLVNDSQEKSFIKSMNNKILKNYENGLFTIKLSSNLLKRIQNGQNLFMCVECNKMYTEHKDLLDHQMTHDKCTKKIIDSKEKREREHANNFKICGDIKNGNEKFTNDTHDFNKQTKPILKSSVNSKKRKVIFQGECIMCHSVFPDLGKHIRTVHQNDLNKNKGSHLQYNCFKCDMKFDTKQHLHAHDLHAHKPIYSHTCEHCYKDFTYKADLETHMETHFNDSKKYLCPYCDVGFSHSNGLRTHLVKHIGSSTPENSAFEIPDCKIEYSPTRPPEQLDQLFEELNNISNDVDDVYNDQVSDDNYRVKLANEETNKLSIINSLTTENLNIDKELNNVPLETTLSDKTRISYTMCRICLIIVSYSRIGRHMKKKHNNAAPYQCEVCHAEFNRKHIMDDHRRKHTNNKPHKCIQCSKCFTYKHHLNRHMMIVHNGDSIEKPFKCSVCDKAFSFKEYLTLHVNSRHKGKHYMCQICGKSFSTNAALNKHQLCHTDERPFMCEHCGRTFKCKTHCDTHKKNMHPGDPELALPPEKFECNLCNKKFSTKVYRDMHLKRHNGLGHQCDICYKLFVSKAHMRRHIKIMHRN